MPNLNDIRNLSRQINQIERETAQALEVVGMKLERLDTPTTRVTSGGTVPSIPTALTDLDTTVTGAQLNAKHLAGAASTSSVLGTTVSAGYVQAEVQAIVDKLDELIGYFAALVGILDTAQITGAATDYFLLLESGDYFLLETGDKLILE